MFFHILFVLLHSPSADTRQEVYAWAFAVLVAAGSLQAGESFLQSIGFAPLLCLLVRAAWPVAIGMVELIRNAVATAFRFTLQLPPGIGSVVLAFLTFGLAVAFSFGRPSLSAWVNKKQATSQTPDEPEIKEITSGRDSANRLPET